MRKSKTNVYERMHIESSKMVLMDLFAGQQGRHRHREQTCGHSGGRKKGNRESSIDICTPPRVKSTADEKLLYNIGSSA